MPVASPDLLAGLWVPAGLFLYWSFGYSITWGSDLWWHLAAGRWMWTTRSLPHVDPFSFTRLGKPWLHHEWLSDIVFYLWSSTFGMRSLVFWKWGVIAVAFLLVQFTLQRLTRNPLASFAVAAWGAAVAAPFLDLRPQLFSILGTAVLFTLALVPRTLIVWLPILFLIWANLHGGFFFGLMALGLILLVRELVPDEDRPESRRRRIAIFGLCLAAASANVNGLAAFVYPLRYAFDTKSPFRQIGEWHSPFEAGGTHSPLYPWTIGLFFLCVAGLWVTGAWHSHRRLFFTGLALGSLTLAMSLRSRRFVPFFGIAACLMLAPALDAIVKTPRRRFLAVGLPFLGILAGIARLSRFPLGPHAFHTLTSEESFPVDTADFLQTNTLSGNVFTLYNWGGYVEMRSGGRLRVYIDGRADTVFDEGTYRRYLSIAAREPGWERSIADSGSRFVLWPREDRQFWEPLLQSGHWRSLYEDSVSCLLVREAEPPFGPFRDPPDSAYRRFTLAVKARMRGDLQESETQLHEALARMPEMSAPCHLLARLQAIRGDLPSALATEATCQRSFPQPLRKREFEGFLDELRRRNGH
jgi:hypothetical protein